VKSPIRAVLIWAALFGLVIVSLYLPWFWWNVLVISLMTFSMLMVAVFMLHVRQVRQGKRPITERVWFWKPSWYWYGWRTLVPFSTGGDEWDWHTIVLGWTITGRIIIATRQCPRTGKCTPDPDWPHEYDPTFQWPDDPYPDRDFDDNPYPTLAYYRSLPQYQHNKED
jgi:hypothetical protein